MTETIVCKDRKEWQAEIRIGVQVPDCRAKVELLELEVW